MRANILSVVLRCVHDTVGEIGPISPAYQARARAAKRERRVVALLFPFIQATARRQLSATAVATCCKCVFTSRKESQYEDHRQHRDCLSGGKRLCVRERLHA